VNGACSSLVSFPLNAKESEICPGLTLLLAPPGERATHLAGIRANGQPVLADSWQLPMLDAIRHSALNMCCSATIHKLHTGLL